jgi:hypothetical protein
LAGEYRRIFIRAWYRNTYPRQTLRANDLMDLPIMTHTLHSKDEASLNQWCAEGGVLLNYFPGKYFVPTTDVFVWCEAPFSMAQLDYFTENTESVVLIFKPYSWVEFRNTVGDQLPTGPDCQRMFDYLVGMQERQNPEHTLMAQALNIHAPGVFAVSDEQMEHDLFINHPTMNSIKDAIKNCIGGYQYHCCIPVILRVEPKEENAAVVYRYILLNCPKVGKWHIVDPRTMSRSRSNWRAMVKLMNRRGNIKREWLVYFYYLTGRLPDVVALQRQYEAGMGAIGEVEKFVEALPVYAHE